MSYKAFISYSHAADGQLAPTLQSGLQRFAKPFYRLRAMRIFRDETSLHLTPKLWPTIQQALKESENFILMASPASAGSKWVQDEIDEWLSNQNGLTDKFFIVLTEGEIEWEDSTNDFDWGKTTALPESLRGKFHAEPLFLDFRWARTSEHLSLRNPQFLKAIGKLAAVLHNKPLDDIVGDDVRQHRVFKVVAGIAIVLLLALAIATSVTAYIANERRKEAVAAAENERLAREAEKKQRELAEIATNNEKDARNQAEVRRKEAEDERGKAEQRRQEAEEQKKEAKRQQGFAEENAAEAKRRLINLYEEQGRRESLNGDGQRAMMYLSEAYKEGSKRSSLRFLLAHVAREFNGQISSMIGHNAEVNAAHFSLDGRRLVTASSDRTAIVWDVVTGERISVLKPGQSIVRQAYISPDGRRVITVANHLVSDADISVIKLWNADTGAEIADLSSELGEFGFSADSSRFFAILVYEPAIYEAASGKELFKLKGHEQEIFHVAFERGNKRLLSASADKVALRDGNGKELSSFRPQGDVKSVFFSPDGPRIITEENRLLKLWNAESGAQIPAFNSEAANFKITVSADGARIATCRLLDFQIWSAGDGTRLSAPKIDGQSGFQEFNSDLSLFFTVNSEVFLTTLVSKGLNVWDTNSGKLLASFEVPGGLSGGAKLSADGKLIFYFGADNVGRVWDWRKLSVSGDLDLTLATDVVVSSANFSSDGERIITKYGKRGEASTTEFFDAADGKQLSVPPSVQAAKIMAVSPNGRLALYTQGANAQIRDIETGGIITTLDRQIKEITHAEFSPNGQLLATHNDETTVLEIWSAANGAHIASLTYDKEDDDELFLELVSFKFSPDSSRIVTAILESDEGAIMRADVWSSTTGKHLLAKGIVYMGTQYDALPIISLDNGRLITPNGTEKQAYGTPLVWNISSQTPKQMFQLKGHFGRISMIAFDNVGHRLLTASADGTAKVWNAQTGALLASLNGHKKEVASALFDSSGELIVTASADSTVKVWNADTGEELTSLADYSFHGVKFAAFSPNGNLRILTIAGDNIVSVLDARLENRNPQVLTEMARQLLPFRFYNGRPLPVAR